jgi:hypothetical protein
MVGMLPIIGAFFVAFEMPYDSIVYVAIAITLVGTSVGLSFVSIPHDLRIAILHRMLLQQRLPVQSPASQEKHGS